ncbi:MAG: hypothetical protein RBU23_07660 [Candidatus Auribacterota bacterium]|nr:hypothetical protein [Candidatus Auribacterota bacterium]
MIIIEWIITIAIVLTAIYLVARSFYRSSTGKDSPCAGCTSTACASKKHGEAGNR